MSALDVGMESGGSARLAHVSIMQPQSLPDVGVEVGPAVCAATATVTYEEPGIFYNVSKRIIDIAGALLGLMLLGLLTPPIALLIALEDGWPIFYQGEAVGRFGRRFRVYKFRSMCRNADRYFELHPEYLPEYLANYKLPRDPRVTRVGRMLRKSSLDELPQFVNVLRGEMSLVGPRYVHPNELARYGAFALQRLQMRPGITGLWQVSKRCDSPYQARVLYDRSYYYTRSLFTDLAILLATIPAVLRRRGAY